MTVEAGMCDANYNCNRKSFYIRELCNRYSYILSLLLIKIQLFLVCYLLLRAFAGQTL